jgi:hypothetical protein
MLRVACCTLEGKSYNQSNRKKGKKKIRGRQRETRKEKEGCIYTGGRWVVVVV